MQQLQNFPIISPVLVGSPLGNTALRETIRFRVLMVSLREFGTVRFLPVLRLCTIVKRLPIPLCRLGAQQLFRQRPWTSLDTLHTVEAVMVPTCALPVVVARVTLDRL